MRIWNGLLLTVALQLSCGDGKTEETGDDWSGDDATCSDGLRVTGQFEMSDTVLAIDEVQGSGLTFFTEHKIDIDLHEAGCISAIGLQIEQGGLGCRIDLGFASTAGGGFALSSLSFSADSYCPDFDDELEGEYQTVETVPLDTWGLPTQVTLETGTEERACLNDVDFRFVADGTLHLADSDMEHPFELDLNLAGDYWSNGSTSADCDATADADADAGGDSDADADAGGDSDADAGEDPNADNDGDGFTVWGDCDDGNGSIYPGATEIPYDGIDQDCDDSDLTDVDGDGHDAIVAGGDDCDDTEPSAYPGATEVCDSLDNDCDEFVDEEGAADCTQWYLDEDDDGYGTGLDDSKCLCGPTGDYDADNVDDCDDEDDEVHPGYEGWATFETSAGSWDWNCDGIEEGESVDFGSCSGAPFCSLDSEGWAGAPPGCGEFGLWVNACDGTSLTCDESGESRAQGCR